MQLLPTNTHTPVKNLSHTMRRSYPFPHTWQQPTRSPRSTTAPLTIQTHTHVKESIAKTFSNDAPFTPSLLPLNLQRQRPSNLTTVAPLTIPPTHTPSDELRQLGLAPLLVVLHGHPVPHLLAPDLDERVIVAAIVVKLLAEHPHGDLRGPIKEPAVMRYNHHRVFPAGMSR